MIKYLLSLFLVISTLSYAETGFYPVESRFYPSLKSCCDPFCCPSAIRLHCGYAVGRFIGLKQGYGELGAFFTPGLIRNFQPLGDLKIYRLNNGQFASSIGGGARWKDAASRIWGGNLFYDFRKGHLGNFNRIGLGAELLNVDVWGLCFDFRLNGYFPFNSERTRHEPSTNPEIHFRKVEFTYAGLDLEAGTQLWQGGKFSVYGALGPYYWHPGKEHHDNRYPKVDKKHVFGGQARLGLNWTRYLSFEARVSFDNVFKTNAQGKIILDLPLPILLYECDPDEGMTQPIYRNGVIFEKYQGDWPEKLSKTKS